MVTKLKSCFPMIRTRADLLAEINNNPYLARQFYDWTGHQQEEFLDICTGVRGVKILYDAFFKEIMNPETAPEYLEEFLSLLLKKQIKILYVLPNDSTRIADENALLVTDIVVQLEDCSLANVEIQKIGYLFPGERSACYSADLLLRQYKRVRGMKKQKFSYKDIKNVYTIILFEKSPKPFRKFPINYLHYFEQRSDTGLEMELLQKYIFIPLDIFQKIKHNKIVTSKLDAWLMFFCTDDPEDIIRLIKNYPEFKPLYEKVYDICRNMEKVMGIFSEELLQLDRNTTQYMIDVMQDEINEKSKIIEEMNKTLEQKKKTLEQRDKTLQQKEKTLQQREKTLQQKEKTLITQIRNFVEENISMDKCAKMLATDIGLVQQVYKIIQENPDLSDSEILEYINRVSN